MGPKQAGDTPPINITPPPLIIGRVLKSLGQPYLPHRFYQSHTYLYTYCCSYRCCLNLLLCLGEVHLYSEPKHNGHHMPSYRNWSDIFTNKVTC